MQLFPLYSGGACRGVSLLHTFVHALVKLTMTAGEFSRKEVSESIIHQILATGMCSIDDKDSNGDTALHLAYSSIHFPLLLSLGADPNIMDSRGQYALHGVVKAGMESNVVALLQHPKVDYSCWDKYGRTPLSMAKKNTNIWNLLQNAVWSKDNNVSRQSLNPVFQADKVDSAVPLTSQPEEEFGVVEENNAPDSKKQKLSHNNV